MNESQRKVLIAASLLLAPALFVGGAAANNLSVALGGPIVSTSAAVFLWVGRTRNRKTADDGEAPASPKAGRLVLVAVLAAFASGVCLTLVALLHNQLRSSLYAEPPTPQSHVQVRGREDTERLAQERDRANEDLEKDLLASWLDTLSAPISI